jgi:hypothetical protein
MGNIRRRRFELAALPAAFQLAEMPVVSYAARP